MTAIPDLVLSMWHSIVSRKFFPAIDHRASFFVAYVKQVAVSKYCTPHKLIQSEMTRQIETVEFDGDATLLTEQYFLFGDYNVFPFKFN